MDLTTFHIVFPDIPNIQFFYHYLEQIEEVSNHYLFYFYNFIFDFCTKEYNYN